MIKKLLEDFTYVIFMGICAWVGVLVTEWFITVPNWQNWYIASGVITAIFVRCLNRYLTNQQEKSLKGLTKEIEEAQERLARDLKNNPNLYGDSFKNL